MRKNIKFLVVCAILAGAGIMLAGIGIAMGGIVYGIQINAHGIQVYAPLLTKDGNGADAYIQKEESLDPFDSIEVYVEYADIRVEQGDSDAYMLSYCLSGDQDLQKEVKDGKLTLRHGSSAFGKKQVNITWFFLGSSIMDTEQDQFMTIYVPKDVRLSDVQINTDSGDAVCEHIQADSLYITADYGDVSLCDVQAQKIDTVMESGKLQMEQVQGDSCSVADEYGNASFYEMALTGELKIEMESGDVRFRDISAKDLVLESSYGEINGQRTKFGSLLMTVESGDCEFQEILLDSCKIRSSYGNVGLALEKDVTDYKYHLATEYGSIRINEQELGESYVSFEKGKEHLIEIQCESGDIRIQ